MLELSDTVSEARPAATAILVRFTDQSPEVLLLKRNEALKHMPGLWVFPGAKWNQTTRVRMRWSKPDMVRRASYRKRRGCHCRPPH